MTIDEFFNKWNNKPADFDGYYGAQCVDIIQYYNQEVFGGPFLSGAGAADLWETYPVDFYQRVLNTIDAIPQKGDIVIWKKTTTLPFGHISIFRDGDINKFTSFDQNWPTGSNSHFVDHNYLKPEVLGWLHPIKNQIGSETYYLGIDLNNKESVKVCVATWKDVVDGKYVKIEEMQKKVDEVKNLLSKTVSDYKNQILAKEVTIGNLNGQITELQKEKNKLADDLSVCQLEGQSNAGLNDKLIQCTQELNQLKLNYEKLKSDYELMIVAKNNEIKTLTNKYNATKSPIKKLLIDYIFGKTL